MNNIDDNEQEFNWRDSWKDNWKGRYQGKDGYQYERPSEESGFSKFKNAANNSKSEYVNVRRKARAEMTKILLPCLGTVALVVLFLLWQWGII